MVTIRTTSEAEENGDGPPPLVVSGIPLQSDDSVTDPDMPSSSYSDSAHLEPEASASDEHISGLSDGKSELVRKVVRDTNLLIQNFIVQSSAASSNGGQLPGISKMSHSMQQQRPLINGSLESVQSIREALHMSQKHTIAIDVSEDGDSGTEDIGNDRSALEDADDLPAEVWQSLHDQLFDKQPAWRIPVQQNQELSQLLDCSVHLVAKGADRTSASYAEFLKVLHDLIMPRLMTFEDLRIWKGDIHVNIWNLAVKFLRLFAEKLRHAAEDEQLLEYFSIARDVLSHRSLYHAVNVNRPLTTGTRVQVDQEVRHRFLEHEPGRPHKYGERHFTVLYKFAEFGGFAALKSFLDERVPTSQDIDDLICWMSIPAELYSFAKPEALKDVSDVAVKHCFRILEQISDKDIKCDSVDLNFEVPVLTLMRLLQTILLGYKGLFDEEHAHMSRVLDLRQLNCLLRHVHEHRQWNTFACFRVIQMAKFTGRLRGLDELYRVFFDKSHPVDREQPTGFVFVGTDFHSLIQWARESDLLAVLLRDNLHQPTYVERIERVLAVIIEKESFSERDLDTLWSAQLGKHDAIQRNLHMLMAKLSRKFAMPLIDLMLYRFFETWRTASLRERALLLDLMSNLLDESTPGYRKELQFKCAELLWNIFVDESTPMDKLQLEMLLNRQICVLDSPIVDEVAELYIDRCVDVIRTKPRLAVFVIRHLEKLIPMTVDNGWNADEKFNRLMKILNKYDLITLICTDLERYVTEARQFVHAHPEVDTSQGHLLVVDGIEAHSAHLFSRISLIKQVINEPDGARLTFEQVKTLWHSMIEEPALPEDRQYGFHFLKGIIGNNDTHLVEEDALKQLMTECMLHFSVAALDREGFRCFTNAAIKSQITREQYMPYLWDAVLNGTNDVSTEATKQIIEESMSVALRNKDDHHRVRENAAFIDDCFKRIDEVYQQLLLGGDDDDTDTNATRTARVVRVLSTFVQRWSDDWRPSTSEHLPLGKAAMGRCYNVQLHVTAEDFETTVPVMNHFRARSYSMTQSNKYSGLGCLIAVHDNMTVRDLKQRVQRLVHKHMGLTSSTQPTPFILEQLEANSTEHANEILNELTWRRSNKNGIRPLCRRHLRMTLRDARIPPGAVLTVQFRPQSNFKKISNRNEDSDGSSTASSSLSDVTESDDDADVPRMPSIEVASNEARMERIFKLYDMGCGLKHDALKRESHKLLWLLPLSNLVINLLLENTTETKIRELFERESVSESKTVYLLEVVDALLMPSHAAEHHEFRQAFIMRGGAQQLLALFTQHADLSKWSIEFRIRAFELLARIVRYTCSVVAVIKRALLPDDETLQMSLRIIEKIPYAHEEFYKTSVNQLAMSIKAALNPPFIMQAVDSFRVELTHIYGLLMVAWTTALGVDYAKHFSAIRQEFREQSANQARHNSAVLKDRLARQTELFENTMDAVALCSVFCQNFDALFDGFTLGGIGLCDVAVDVMLLAPVAAMRDHLAALFPDIIEHCAINCPPRDQDAMTAKITQRAKLLVNNFFAKLDEAALRWQQCAQFFRLLCTSVKICADRQVQIDDFLTRLKNAYAFLNTAKAHTTSHCESYPKDDLLVGYLNLLISLVPLLSVADKQRLGLMADGGVRLISDLLHYFILPHSKAYTDLSRLENTSSGTPSLLEATPVNGVQRSASTSNVFQALNVGSPDLRAIPRSATAPLLANPIVPVCGSEASVKATYDLIVALSFDCPVNLKIVLDELAMLFYTVQPPRQEWDYSPNFIPRSPSNFVGLKNAGATCYMNSIFQQLFTIRPLCQAIVNAKCEELQLQGSSQTAADDCELPIIIGPDAPAMNKEEYPMAVLRCVQTMFAHLIGSKVQYFVPRQFWDTFMFNGSHMNPREQQDALEFFNAVADVLDEGMKKVNEAPVFEKLFGGTFADQKICKDCPHRYEREEPFTSISVDVRSHNNLLDSMKEYVKGDLLDNDNAYLCEQCDKKVAAVKRLCIKTLPPYLVIQLKRFDFDWEREVAVKHNDYFEFPMEINMEPYTADGLAKADSENCNGGPYSPLPETVSSMEDVSAGQPLSATTMRSTSEDSLRLSMHKSVNAECLYRLRGVLVHSGEANGGHYYSFIRGQPDEKRPEGWFKFDDTDVSEWEINKDEVQNQWFGGDCFTDDFGIGKLLTKKRQKRRWNAYLLFYEKANVNEKLTPNRLDASSMDSSSGSYKPLSPNSNMVSMGRRFGSMTLNGTPFTVQMPAALEQLIQLKNLKFLHERSQYAPQYFAFVHNLCTEVARSWVKKVQQEPAVQDGPAQKVILLWATALMSQFLFRTCLRAKSDLRSFECLRDFRTCYEVFLHADRTVREWFFKNIILTPEILYNFLVDAPAQGIRDFFANVVLIFLRAAREDTLAGVDLSGLGNGAFFVADRTITDCVLRLLTLVPRNRFNEFLRQPQQFFDLINAWRMRFNNVGALGILLMLVQRDDHRTRNVFTEFPVVFNIIYVLFAAYSIAPQQEQWASANGSVPDARRMAVFAPPADIKEWITDGMNVQKLIRQLLEYTVDEGTVRAMVHLLCRENWPITRKVFQLLNFDKFAQNNREQRNTICAFHELMQLADSQQRERIVLGVVGDFQRVSGLAKILVNMRDRVSVQKPLLLLDQFVAIWHNVPPMFDALAGNNEFAEAFFTMTEWLEQLIQNKSQSLYRSYQRLHNADERDLAVALLEKCHAICDRLRQAGAAPAVQEPIRVDDMEEDEGVQELGPPTMVVPAYGSVYPAGMIPMQPSAFAEEDATQRVIAEELLDDMEPSAGNSDASSGTDDETNDTRKLPIEAISRIDLLSRHQPVSPSSFHFPMGNGDSAPNSPPPPHDNNSAKKRDSQHFDIGSPPPYDATTNQPPKSKLLCQEGGVVGTQSEATASGGLQAPLPSYEDVMASDRSRSKSPSVWPIRGTPSKAENGTATGRRMW